MLTRSGRSRRYEASGEEVMRQGLWVVFLLLFSLGALAKEQEDTFLTARERAWIAAHPVVKFGADYDWPPYDFRDEHGEHAGIAADMLTLIAQKSGLHFQVETDVWAKTMAKMGAGELDGLACAAATPERKRHLLFTDPYVTMPLAMIVRKEVEGVVTMEDLASRKVALNRDSYLHEWFAEKYPETRLYLANSNKEALEAVAFGKADVYVGNIAVASYIMEKGFLSNLKIAGRVPQMNTSVSIAVDMSQPVLFSIIRKTLSRITPAEKEHIVHKWYKQSKEAVRKSRVKLSAREKAWILSHPVVRVGGGPDWAPVDFVHDGRYSGIAKDYLDLIAAKTGLHFEVVVEKWSRNLEKIKNGTIDMLDAVYYRQERAAYMHFTQPYFELLDYFFIRKDLKARSLSDLDGYRAAMPRGYAHGKILEKAFPKIKIVWVDTFQEAVDAVAEGKADMLFDTFASISYVLQKEGIGNIVPFQAYRGEEVNKIHMAVRPGMDMLASILNKGLAAITPEEAQRIRDRWLISPPDYTWFYQIAALLLILLLGTAYWNRKLSREVAKRKEAEAALLHSKMLLEAQTRKAVEANRAKSAFLSNMSHEIRTPMNAIIGFTELLDEEVTGTRQKSYVRTIRSAGNALMLLINDILDLSKIEAGKLKIVNTASDLHRLAEEIGAIFMPEVRKKGLDLMVDVSDEVPASVLLDEVRLRQILLNLVGNAVKFTEKGHIILRIRVSRRDEHLSKVDLKIEVKDTGIGIPASQLEKIFGYFEQVDSEERRKFGGTGLGLAISSKLARMMDGVLSVESAEGEGATFTLLLHHIDIASAVQEKQAASLAADEAEQIVFEKALILVADDVESNRDLIVNHFEHTALRVVTACDGSEAVAVFEREKPDLVLMDIRMPVMDGYEAAAAIRAESDVPIVALTASVMAEELTHTGREYFDGFLRKPILRRDLLVELSRFLPHRALHAETTASSPVPELGEKAKKAFETIREKFEKEIVPQKQRAARSHNMADISQFATAVKTVAAKYEIEMFVRYAEDLEEAVGAYDIAAIERLMHSFDAMVEMFVSLEG